MKKVLVIGSANMDVITPIHSMPAPGETVLAGEVSLVPGGKGANAAVASARLGAAVRFVGCIGSDVFGDELRESLQNDRIDVTRLVTCDRRSGTAVILLDERNGENAIIVSPGANLLVEAPEDDDLYAWADIVMLQLEIPINTVLLAAKRARSHGAIVMLDPAPAIADLPSDLLATVDILLPNESELATLTGKPTETLGQIIEAATSLIGKTGIGQIVVTLGSRGAMWVSPTTTQHFPALSINAVDTTAAGDTFAGALAASLSLGDKMPDALKFAITAGSLACTRLGAQPSIPTRSDVIEKMDIRT